MMGENRGVVTPGDSLRLTKLSAGDMMDMAMPSFFHTAAVAWSMLGFSPTSF